MHFIMKDCQIISQYIQLELEYSIKKNKKKNVNYFKLLNSIGRRKVWRSFRTTRILGISQMKNTHLNMTKENK